MGEGENSDADEFTATLEEVTATAGTEVTAAELEAAITNLPDGATTDAAAFTPDAEGEVTKEITITFADESKTTVEVTVNVEAAPSEVKELDLELMYVRPYEWNSATYGQQAKVAIKNAEKLGNVSSGNFKFSAITKANKTVTNTTKIDRDIDAVQKSTDGGGGIATTFLWNPNNDNPGSWTFSDDFNQDDVIKQLKLEIIAEDGTTYTGLVDVK